MARSRRSTSFEPTAQTPVVLLHGKESFLMRERTRQFVEVLESEWGEIERFSFDGATVDLATVLDELRSYGLMQQHKLVILDRADQFLSGQESRRRALENYVSSPVDHATLLLRAETWRAGNLDKAIAKVGLVYKIEAVDDATAASWCVQRVSKRYQATLDRTAAVALVTLLGPDLDRLDCELDKLANFVGAAGHIGQAEIMEMVGLSREQQAWVIQSALVSGDPAHAVTTLRHLLEVSRQPEQPVSWAIIDLVRKLHAASRLLKEGCPPAVAARELKLWGDARDQVIRAAGRSSPHRLAQLLLESVESDWRAKRGFGRWARSLEGLSVLVTDTIGTR